jgi:hypothetical protein
MLNSTKSLCAITQVILISSPVLGYTIIVTLAVVGCHLHTDEVYGYHLDTTKVNTPFPYRQFYGVSLTTSLEPLYPILTQQVLV